MPKRPSLDISVIIPFKDRSKMTLDCVKSFQKYGPEVKEILLVSNNSSPDNLKQITEFSKQYSNIKILEYNHPFNYQIVNNWAATQSKGSFLYFLNNDTELQPKSRDLVENMYAKAGQNKVGVVGCLLLYGDKTVIQHAGVFLVSGGLADHMYVGKKYNTVMELGGKSDELPYNITSDRKTTAVTAASIIVEKTKFNAVNGFDERFILCGGDVDLCIRMNTRGFQTWFLGDGGKYILHKESQSRKLTPVLFNDFYYSYLSYMNGYDTQIGDPFLPKICKLNEVVT